MIEGWKERVRKSGASVSDLGRDPMVEESQYS